MQRLLMNSQINLNNEQKARLVKLEPAEFDLLSNQASYWDAMADGQYMENDFTSHTMALRWQKYQAEFEMMKKELKLKDREIFWYGWNAFTSGFRDISIGLNQLSEPFWRNNPNLLKFGKQQSMGFKFYNK